MLATRAVAAARATKKLKSKLASADAVCIYVNDNFGNWRSNFATQVEQCANTAGAPHLISTLLKPAPRDMSILKPYRSAFHGTPLECLLESLNINKLALTGIAVDMCVLATAQDAVARNFDIWIPADCVAGFSAREKRQALDIMNRTLNADIIPANPSNREIR